MGSRVLHNLLAKLVAEPDRALALVRRLFVDVYRTHSATLAAAVAFMIGGAGATAGLALLMRHVINTVVVEQHLGMILMLSLAIVGVSIAKGAASYGQTIMLSRIGNGMISLFQRRVFDKVLSLGVDYFARRHSSQIVARISNNARAARDVVSLVSTSLGRDLLTVVALGGVMIYLDPVLSLFALCIVPPVLLMMSGLSRRIREVSSDEYKSMAAVAATAQETVHGIKVIKSFTLENPMRDRLDEAVTAAERRANAITHILASRAPIMESLRGVGVGLVVSYVGWRMVVRGETPGDFMAFMTAFLLAYGPAKRLVAMNLNLQRALAGVHQLFEFLDLPGREPEKPGAAALGRVKGQLALTDVTFGYREKKPILRGVSIDAEPGSVVALVGPSGAGKTTIVNLIQRFYDPWSGSITIDGIDIRTVTIESLRRQVSFVSQDTFLFSGTVRENIALGSPAASDAEIRAAAEASGASGFIAELPKQLDTSIGENGVTLSGGQRQRIAIARAVLKDAPILILDEATSALDVESERQVQGALERLMRGRTTIVIAHRLSTIARADRTYAIDAGEIIESGSHSSLIASNHLYARLFGPGNQDGPREGALAKEWQVAEL